MNFARILIVLFVPYFSLTASSYGQTSKKGDTPDSSITLRLAYTVPIGSRVDKVAHKFQELVESQSNNQIKVKLYPAAQLAADRDIIDLLQAGSVDMNIQGSTIFNIVTPEFGAISCLFMFDSQNHFRKFLAGEYGKKMEDSLLKRKGIQTLAVLNEGSTHITSRDRPILKPGDFKGFKVRTPEIPVDIATMKVLGAIPSVIAFNELFTALQQGIVDGQYNPLDTIYNSSFQEVQKHLTIIGMKRQAKWIFISNITVQKLNLPFKNLVSKAAKECALYGDNLQSEEEEAYLAKFKATRMQIHQANPESFAKIVQETIPKQFEKKWEPGIIENIRGLR